MTGSTMDIAMRGYSRQKLLFAAYGIIAVVAFPKCANGQLTVKELRGFVAESVRNRAIALTPPRIEVRDNKLRYGFEGAVKLEFDWDDSVLLPLEEECIVMSIRRFRNSPVQQRFWNPVLEQVEAEINGMLSDVRGNTSETDGSVRVHQRAQRIREIYLQAMEGEARRNGLSGAAYIVKTYTVSKPLTRLNTDPEDGRIRYMRTGPWELHVYLTRVGQSSIAPTWNSLAVDDSLGTGRYFVSVTWTGKTARTYAIRVTDQEELVFTPRTVYVRKSSG